MEEEQGLVKLEQLHEILRGYPGNYPLELTLCLADGSRVPCACADFRVGITPEMRLRVEELLGPGNFRLQTARAGNGRKCAAVMTGLGAGCHWLCQCFVGIDVSSCCGYKWAVARRTTVRPFYEVHETLAEPVAHYDSATCPLKTQIRLHDDPA